MLQFTLILEDNLNLFINLISPRSIKVSLSLAGSFKNWHHGNHWHFYSTGSLITGDKASLLKMKTLVSRCSLGTSFSQLFWISIVHSTMQGRDSHTPPPSEYGGHALILFFPLKRTSFLLPHLWRLPWPRLSQKIRNLTARASSFSLEVC